MIKIIKRGKGKPFIFEGTCRECGTKVECQEGDTQWMEGDRPGDPGNRYIKCPVCKHEHLWVSEKS